MKLPRSERWETEDTHTEHDKADFNCLLRLCLSGHCQTHSLSFTTNDFMFYPNKTIITNTKVLSMATNEICL